MFANGWDLPYKMPAYYRLVNPYIDLSYGPQIWGGAIWLQTCRQDFVQSDIKTIYALYIQVYHIVILIRNDVTVNK